MTRKLTAGRRFARSLLLVAALLQFGAVAIGPWAHLAGADLRAAPAWAAAESDAPGGGSLHTDGDCLVCHTLAAAVPLPRTTSAPLPSRIVALGAPEPAGSIPSSFVAFPSARSPPVS